MEPVNDAADVVIWLLAVLEEETSVDDGIGLNVADVGEGGGIVVKVDETGLLVCSIDVKVAVVSNVDVVDTTTVVDVGGGGGGLEITVGLVVSVDVLDSLLDFGSDESFLLLPLLSLPSRTGPISDILLQGT